VPRETLETWGLLALLGLMALLVLLVLTGLLVPPALPEWMAWLVLRAPLALMEP
jgi:thiosulfate reductase cytochrome b subunit